jgi:hypothetical protein
MTTGLQSRMNAAMRLDQAAALAAQGVPTVNGKPWYHSKTIWFNALCLVLGAVELNFKLLEGHIPGAVYSALAFVLPIGNVLLRFITTTALIVPKVDQPAPVPPAQGGFLSAGLAQALLVTLVLGALVAAGFVAGRDRERSQWQTKEAAQQKADQAERDRLTRLAAIAAQFEIDEQRRAAERNAHLEGVMKNARSQFALTVRPGVAAPAAGSPSACVSGSLPADGAAQQEPHVLVLPVPVDTDPVLTLGAIWLWNAALTGQAAAPAGACRVDEGTGQADPACADSSGLTLDDAWDNHKANARACAEDRARHQRLIDYLNKVSPTLLSK